MSQATPAPCRVCVEETPDDIRDAIVREMCQRHYNRARRRGEIAPTYTPRNPEGICYADCDRPVEVKELCRSHYARKMRGMPNWDGPLIERHFGATCSASWEADGETVVCGDPNHGGGLCSPHYWQRRNGKVFTPIARRTEERRGGPCAVEECHRLAVNDYLCSTHYDRRRRGEENWDRPIREKAPDGAGYVNDDGYRVAYFDGERRPEHVGMFEELLGRRLREGETVHHMWGDRELNIVDGPLRMTPFGNLYTGNLELWSSAQPAGQQIGHKMDYAEYLYGEYLHLLNGERLERLVALAARVTPEVMEAARARDVEADVTPPHEAPTGHRGKDSRTRVEVGRGRACGSEARGHGGIDVVESRPVYDRWRTGAARGKPIGTLYKVKAGGYRWVPGTVFFEAESGLPGQSEHRIVSDFRVNLHERLGALDAASTGGAA